MFIEILASCYLSYYIYKDIRDTLSFNALIDNALKIIPYLARKKEEEEEREKEEKETFKNVLEKIKSENEKIKSENEKIKSEIIKNIY